MIIQKEDYERLDRYRMQNAVNTVFMETIFTIASKYNLFSDEDIELLTTRKSHDMFGASSKPILIEITNLSEGQINKLIRDDYDNGSSYVRYYRKPEYRFGARVFLASNDMYGKYKDGKPRSSDNRTPLYEWFMSKIDNVSETASVVNKPDKLYHNEDKMSTKQKIEQIKRYIKANGFNYTDELIENFYLCLKTKPFVILAGISGTGKSKLVKLFAEAISANYKLVSIRPDWSDSSDLFGHTNLTGNFIPGAITDYVMEAIGNLDQTYILCLDEMNLARVEYYLSDFLSVIETRKFEEGTITTDVIELAEEAKGKYKDFYLPENLYIIGTVNMDETTFPFSKKVLDRANTIEFSDVDLIPSFETITMEPTPINVSNDFLRSKYITLLKDTIDEQRPLISQVCVELQEINEILVGANVHVGYRIRDEISFYILNNDEEKLLEYEDALDFEIMQKILPRIQGSSSAIKDLLEKLFNKFAGDYSSYPENMKWKQMKRYLSEKRCLYYRSAQKVCYMMRRFEEDGFTSYWL